MFRVLGIVFWLVALILAASGYTSKDFQYYVWSAGFALAGGYMIFKPSKS